MRDVKAENFVSLPLPPLDDVNFAYNFLILKFFGKNLLSQGKTASSQIIVLNT